MNRLDRLFLRTDEDQTSAIRCDLLNEISGFLCAHDRFLQIDDVDAPACREHVRFHFWIPALCLVTEVHARIEHVFHSDMSHMALLIWFPQNDLFRKFQAAAPHDPHSRDQ